MIIIIQTINSVPYITLLITCLVHCGAPTRRVQSNKPSEVLLSALAAGVKYISAFIMIMPLLNVHITFNLLIYSYINSFNTTNITKALVTRTYNSRHTSHYCKLKWRATIKEKALALSHYSLWSSLRSPGKADHGPPQNFKIYPMIDDKRRFWFALNLNLSI